MAGRDERANTRAAKAKLPNLSRYYKGTLREIEPGAFEFTATLLRGKGKPPVGLDEFLESVTWEDASASLTGTLALRRSPDTPRAIPILGGHRVRLRTRFRGQWYDLWTMRAAAPDVNLDGSISVVLADDFQALRRNRRDWSFRKTKRRKRGYYPGEIAKKVAKSEGVRVRRVVRGTHRLTKLVRKDTTALDVLREAYEKEHEKTGIRFILRMINGELEIVKYRRNRVLYVLRDQITGGLLSAEQETHPITVIDAKARVGKGRETKKVERRIFVRSVVRRFGWVAKEKSYGKVSSTAELGKLAKRDLAKEIRPSRTAELTVPGIPFIRRGDGVRWPNKEPGWHGKEVEHSRDRTYVYVRAISHSVDSGGYTSTLTVVQEDPFAKDRERLDEEARKRAEAKRKRRREEEKN